MAASVDYKNWILSADGIYASLGTDNDSRLLTLKLTIKQYILDLRLGYLVLKRVDYKKKTNKEQ